jgi:hypothetical protein
LRGAAEIGLVFIKPAGLGGIDNTSFDSQALLPPLFGAVDVECQIFVEVDEGEKCGHVGGVVVNGRLP